MTRPHSHHDNPSFYRSLTPVLWLITGLTAVFALSPLLPDIGLAGNPGIYLALHGVLEMLAIVMAATLFIVGWNSRQATAASPCRLLLGAGFLGVAVIDFIHMMSIQGMPAFLTPLYPGKGIVFWLAARLLAVMTLFAVVIRLTGRSRSPGMSWGLVGLGWLAAGVISGLGLFAPTLLPALIMPGQGLTPFKVSAEYALFAAHGLAAVLLWRQARRRNDSGLLWLAAAAWTMGLSELYFTLYEQITDLENILGHLFKVAAYLMLYHGILVQSLHQPIRQLETARARLHDAEGRYAGIIESAHDGIVVADSQQRIVVFNPAAEALFGYSRNEVIGQPLDRLLPAGNRDLHARHFESFGRSGITVRRIGAPGEPLLGQRANGEVFPVEISISRSMRDDETLFTAIIRDVSEQMRSEQQRHQIETELRRRVEERTLELRNTVAQLKLMETAIRTSINAVAMSDLTGQLTYVNDAFLSLWGQSQCSEVLGRHVSSFWQDPVDAERVIVAMARDGRWDGVLTGRRSDGATMQLRVSASLVHDENGKPVAMMASFVDVSEQQRAEAAIRLSETRLNEAQKLAKVGSWELDLVSGQLVWSDEIFRIFDLDKSRFGASYEAFLNAIHPDDRERVNQAYTRSLETREKYEIVHRLKMADGRIKWVRETCESFFDINGKPLRSVGTVQDISELHATELELRRHREQLEELVASRTNELHEANQMLHTVLDTAPLRIFWKDTHLNYLGCNRVFAQDAGKQGPQELIGKSDYDLPWNASADMYREDDARVIRSGEAKLSFEEPMDLPDGSRVWLSTSKVPLRNADGRVIGVLGTYENITARKQVETELVTAKEEAERANRAKSEFLSRMSHELRTPMNAILGFAQVLELELQNPEQQDFVQEILRAGSHLLHLINELLDLARIESGRLATVLEPVGLGAVTVDAHHLVRPLLEKKAISLINKCDEQLAVLADPGRLRQVLVNLLSNAAKYNRQGGSVRIDCAATGPDRIRLSVTDTGPGIPAEKLDNLFRPFERLGAEFTEVDGTGIGLSISKRLVELMGGEIGVDSTPGQGSTFWVDLPRAPTTAVALPPTRHPAGTQDVSLQQAKILYVEDNAANLKVIEAIFRKRPGISLITATTGEYGLELARRYRPDLVLLDIHLPGMDGYAVLKGLQEDEATRGIPVVALSADAMPIDIEHGLAAGFRRYLTKPLRIADLDDALAALLAPPRGP